MKRPKFESFFKNKTTEEINKMFLNNKELYNYISSLDNYIDFLEDSIVDVKTNNKMS